jgi:hypothetical protein
MDDSQEPKRRRYFVSEENFDDEEIDENIESVGETENIVDDNSEVDSNPDAYDDNAPPSDEEEGEDLAEHWIE